MTRSLTVILLTGTLAVSSACDENRSSSEETLEKSSESASDAESPQERSDAGEDRSESDRDEFCGNGEVDKLEEECDDGNDDDQDGCTKLCEFTCIDDRDCDDQNPCNGSERCTDDHTCEAGEPLEDRVSCGVEKWCHDSECVETLCGDGIEQPDEECDDGNRDDDDGCTSQCLYACVRDDTARDCASECNPKARCDESSHQCSEGEALKDGTLCDRGKGYCLSGVCVELDCENASDIPSGLCETDDPDDPNPGDSDSDAEVHHGCGDDGPLSAGMYERTVADDRTFIFYVPESLDASQKVPLVFVHHGFTMSGEIMSTLTSWTQIADEEGIVVAFPDGGGSRPWNVGEKTVCGYGERVNNPAQDDFGFVENMIEAIDGAVCIDQTKVFTAGFSMGGYFTHNIACHRPNLVRAVAPHSGGMEIDAECADPRPIIILHGDADPLISYDCALDAREYWTRFNGCSTEVDAVEVKGGICERNRNCPAGAQVEMCSFDGMGHGWAGSEGGYGGGTEYEDAAWIAWRFFKEQMED